MEPIIVSRFDILILRQLFPNHKRTIAEIAESITRDLKKRLINLHSKQILNLYDIDKDEISIEKLKIGLEILCNIEYDYLSVDIEERLDEILTRVTIKDESMNHPELNQYSLTPEGIQYYNRCWNWIQLPVVDLVISLELFPFHPKYELRFPPTLIIVKDLNEDQDQDQDQDSDRMRIISLGLRDIKASHVAFRSLLKGPVYIRGEIDSLGILQNIHFIRQEPYMMANSKQFEITQNRSPAGITLQYTLKTLDTPDPQLYLIHGSLLEPVIPLQEQYWNYTETKYESIRAGMQLELINPEILGNTMIKRFDQLQIVATPSNLFEEQIVDLFKVHTQYRNKEKIALQWHPSKFVIIIWEDLENELGYSKPGILKQKRTLQKKGQESMLIQLEAKISREEIKINRQGNKEFYYHLENCYITALDW